MWRTTDTVATTVWRLLETYWRMDVGCIECSVISIYFHNYNTLTPSHNLFWPVTKPQSVTKINCEWKKWLKVCEKKRKTVAELCSKANNRFFGSKISFYMLSMLFYAHKIIAKFRKANLVNSTSIFWYIVLGISKSHIQIYTKGKERLRKEPNSTFSLIVSIS